MKPIVRLKRGSRGWFAAGPGFERALGRLSDAALAWPSYCPPCSHRALQPSRLIA